MSRGAGAAIPAALFVAVLASQTHGNMGCADSRWSIPTAVSIVDQGNFDLDEYGPLLAMRQYVFVDRVGGHYYTAYPFGASILAAPAIVVLRPIAKLAFRVWPALRGSMARAQAARGCAPADGEPLVSLHSWTEQIVASAIVAAATVVVYAIARADLAPGGAAVVALLFAFGTPAWSTASRSLWQHGPSMLMLAVALLVQIRGWPLAYAGAALAFAYVSRPTDSLPLALTTAWVALEHPRRLGTYAAGAAAVLAPFFAINHAIYGAWLSPYYRPGYYAANPFFWDALSGGLVSPGRGLFVYSPVFLFAPVGVVLRLRTGARTSLDLLLVACLVLHALAIAWVNSMWWGGYSYGPRFYADVVPYLMYFLVPVVGWIARASGARRAVGVGVFTAAAAASVVVHGEGALSTRAAMWNIAPDDIDQNPLRLWDWRRPPFLAPVQDPPAAFDLGSVACDAPPAAPGRVRVISNAHGTVELAWEPARGPVAEYVVESGLAPGASDFAPRGSHSSTPRLTAYRVPPGTYFARVRARNACGESGASEEIRVAVR